MSVDNDLGWRLVVMMLAVLLAVSGCSDEKESPFTPGTGANIPDTPEQLMANFQTIYETMDVEEYKLILDPAFETLLQDATTARFPGVGVTLDVTEENRIHARMFSGEALQDANGNLLPAIWHFSFSQFRALVDWGESLPTDPIPNTLSALYDVEILVDRDQLFSALVVRGSIRFYVTAAEGKLNGQPKTYYRLVGQLDLTSNNKDVEIEGWGSLKAWYH